jgi:hypothetical protein
MPLSKLRSEYQDFSVMCQGFLAGWEVCESTEHDDDMDDMMADHVNRQKQWSDVRKSGILAGWGFASLKRKLSRCHTPITAPSH